ncbi:unnamed protein product [Notodromas monacha]|uniref:Arrestin C-terminal-like domain-containing protein n=1 Tax=Notodromas monacha TaxID=399045 RepID=A0A7R9GEA2_9CRUS|nr:unnamed protein product [Notodromas monacha]CAG0919404.1 unnamed protein product [Notodromas monacha]
MTVVTTRMPEAPRKLQKFLILFDNSSLLYFPGQFVTGRVLVELEEDTPVIGQSMSCPIISLYFHVVGEGVVRLMDRRTRTTDRESYIDFRMKLLGDQDQGPVLLSPGIHSFPFKLGLPLGLPSTFLGKHGWVQYFCKAALREPNGLTHKNQQVFIVMSPIDLNLEPALLASFEMFKPHTLNEECDLFNLLKYKFWQSTYLVSCRVRLDKGGYVPGETINIWANIHNSSKVTIKRTKASLTETIQYMAHNKVIQTETRELSSISRGKVEPGEVADWNNESLYVPPLPPTNLRGCHLMRIQYDVFFVIEPKNLEKEIKLQLPIMMATYPFRNDDGTLRRKRGSSYPTTLPIFRPWLDSKPEFPE